MFDSILDAISSFLLLQPLNILINFVHCLVSQKFLICFLCFAISIFLKKIIFFFPYTDTCIRLHFHAVHRSEDTQISCSVTGNKNQDQIYKFIHQDHVWSNISRCEFEKQRDEILYRWHDQHGWLFLSVGWDWFDWVSKS